jgi:acyl-CoA synthetase (AMP-forming)/AMP-acid ligase II
VAADGAGLHDLLARADAEAVGIVDDGGPRTFGALAADARAVAANLTAAYPPGTVVALLATNSADYVTWLYAVPQAGMRVLLLNVRDHPGGWAAMLTRTGCPLVVGDPDLLDRLAPACNPGTKLQPISGDERDPTSVPPIDPHHTAWLVPTSGTTGTPKLAELSHASLLAAARGCASARPVEPHDVYLLAFPLCHVAAYNVLVQHLHGRPVVLTRRFDPVHTAQLIERHRITAASLAPTMIAALLDDPGVAQHDLSSLRLVAYGSAPIAEPLLRRAMARLGCGFSQGYGMTELSGNCAFLDAADHERGLDEPAILRSAGRPTGFVELRIIDESGRPLDTGAVGEIAVRGPQVMVGYHDDPDATGRAIVDGWLRTGDLGRLDERGYLSVVDRLKDVIVSGGENVASREVEAVLHTHPTVADAAVIGVADERWGERVAAIVVATPGELINNEALINYCRLTLAAYKIPRQVVVVAELPRNATGKVDKPELRRRLAQGSDQEERAPTVAEPRSEP